MYHTNVVLWIGANIAGLGLEWVAPSQRAGLLARLCASGKSVLPLDDAQLHCFAGNMLEVQPPSGEHHLLMSASAAASLREEQRDFINERNKSFGRTDYNLKREMEQRLFALRGLTAARN